MSVSHVLLVERFVLALLKIMFMFYVYVVRRGRAAGRDVTDAVRDASRRRRLSARVRRVRHLRLLVERLSPSDRPARRLQGQLPRYIGGVFLLRRSDLTDLVRCVCRSFILGQINLVYVVPS